MAKKAVPEQQLPLAPYRNQQLFSDYHLANTLPQRADWQALAVQAQPVMTKIAAIFKKYNPSENESQTEDGFVKPVLQALEHTFEIQAPLAAAEGTKKPDYIFYLDEVALNANKGKRLDDHLLQGKAFAVGDAKYWDRPLDITGKKTGSDPFSNKNPSYQIAFYMQHSGLEWGILTNGRLWRLYHRATAHKLDHFYEVDLPMLLQSGNLEQFLYFYAFFHRSAFDAHPLGVSALLKESIDYAQGVGESLKKQVYDALRHVAQGFLDYTPGSLSLDDPATLKGIYDNSLILLYRLLFILYAEARDLLPLSESKLYREHYSLYALNHRITGELDAGVELLSSSVTLWSSFKQLFDYINVGAPPLKIATFNGGLFDPQKHPFLEQYKVGDAQLQQAMDLLARINGQFIDYRDLSIRDLGTIYEGLLEYHLEKAKGEAQDGWTIDLLNDKGERAALTGSSIDLYGSGKWEELLSFVEARLAAQPEQDDVVRDLLSYLAEQMIDLNRRRLQAVEDFTLGLEGILSHAELQKISRLWTPPNMAQTGERDANKKPAEAQEMLGVLAIRVLELHDDIGALNEEQWKWLLKQRLRGPDLAGLVKVYRKFQPPVAALDSEIAATDHLVDQIVYRFYDLTPEEIAIVESSHYKPFMAASIVALSAAEQRTEGSSE